MADALWMKLRDVPWEKYPASPRSTKQIPRILEALSSRKESRAMKAAHDIWTALCSGQVWPAAEPAYPFLIEILHIAHPTIQGEILDILTQFANFSGDMEEFQIRLKELLGKEQNTISRLTKSSDTVVAEKAKELLQKITEIH